jgi:uncharacterized protein (TIGR00369 family)
MSPYHRWLGVELVRAQDGEVEVRLPYRDEFNASDTTPYIHGGILATLADIACIFALMSATGIDLPTVDLRMDYLRMAKTGEDLIATAHTIKAGRTISISDAEIRTRDGRLVAIGRASGLSIPPRE